MTEPLTIAEREQRLKAALWRCIWVQAHAFDGCYGRKGQTVAPAKEMRRREELLAAAIEEQSKLTAEAEALGFTGDTKWLEPA